MAGQNLANPVGAVYAGALLLKYAFDLAEECAAIEAAVQRVLDDGYRDRRYYDPSLPSGQL